MKPFSMIDYCMADINRLEKDVRKIATANKMAVVDVWKMLKDATINQNDRRKDWILIACDEGIRKEKENVRGFMSALEKMF